MKSKYFFILAAFFLIISADRAPAPIFEIAETPTPTPVATATPPPEKRAPPKTKASKPASDKSSAPAVTRPAHTTPAQSPAIAARKRFAGNWTGILSWSFFGDTQFTLVVNESETYVTRASTKFAERPVARAEIHGDMLIARFPGLGGTFELTLNGDGHTAIVHGTAPTADSTGVFRRE